MLRDDLEGLLHRLVAQAIYFLKISSKYLDCARHEKVVDMCDIGRSHSADASHLHVWKFVARRVRGKWQLLNPTQQIDVGGIRSLADLCSSYCRSEQYGLTLWPPLLLTRRSVNDRLEN